jgi:hypothetical protein
MSISSHLPDLVDAYITARAQRLALDKQVEELKEHEELLKDAVIAKMRESNMSACGATHGLVKMNVLKEPVATDWPAIYDYIKENGAWELLHRRLTNTAVKEHWEAGEELPGIGSTEVYKLSISNLK